MPRAADRGPHVPDPATPAPISREGEGEGEAQLTPVTESRVGSGASQAAGGGAAQTSPPLSPHVASQPCGRPARGKGRRLGLALAVITIALMAVGLGVRAALVGLAPASTETAEHGYAVGDIGPAGGLIFFSKGNNDGGWQYLEAAPASTEWSGIKWGAYGVEIAWADGTGVGTGRGNTAAIITALGTGDTYAAQLCAGLSYGGYNDWFLPSRDELDLMYRNLHLKDLGDFAAAHYWSSSEHMAACAWDQDFTNGTHHYPYKFHTYRVRAVRAF